MDADEPTLEQRVARLESLVEALQAGGAGGGVGSAPAERSPAGPALDPDTFWALEELIRRAPEGALLYTGAFDVADRGPVRWQYGGTPDELLAADPDDLAVTLDALAHPVRITLLQLVLGGVRTTSELAERPEFASTGQLHHHLRILVSAGWLTSPSRGRYDVPASRIVPLLTIWLAARPT